MIYAYPAYSGAVRIPVVAYGCTGSLSAEAIRKRYALVTAGVSLPSQILWVVLISSPTSQELKFLLEE